MGLEFKGSNFFEANLDIQKNDLSHFKRDSDLWEKLGFGISHYFKLLRLLIFNYVVIICMVSPVAFRYRFGGDGIENEEVRGPLK